MNTTHTIARVAAALGSAFITLVLFSGVASLADPHRASDSVHVAVAKASAPTARN